jgi:cullin 1
MAEIEGKLESKNYLFVLNSIQAVILLQFNEFREKEVNLKEICTRVGIDSDKELKTYLLPLITSKLLLKCEGSDLGDFIKLNKKFTFNSIRVKILSNPRNEEVIKKEKIEDDRSWAIEATIVRIMKSTQRLHHNELVKRILEQMEHFKVQIHVKISIN